MKAKDSNSNDSALPNMASKKRRLLTKSRAKQIIIWIRMEGLVQKEVLLRI